MLSCCLEDKLPPSSGDFFVLQASLLIKMPQIKAINASEERHLQYGSTLTSVGRFYGCTALTVVSLSTQLNSTFALPDSKLYVMGTSLRLCCIYLIAVLHY